MTDEELLMTLEKAKEGASIPMKFLLELTIKRLRQFMDMNS